MLKGFADLTSAAAATALNSGKEAHKALELLELGRGAIAGLMLDMRTDVSDLRLQHPVLADEFVLLRNELDSPTKETALPTPDHDTQSQESQARRRREANQRFEELIGEVRSQPGFQRFLLPPTADELMAAAQEGPIVVVNMEAILEWLWKVVTRPVLEALAFQNPIQDDKWPRIWWIPTGLLSHFPLHAAGCHMNGSTETVLDRVMSSYSPSIKALVYGRQHSKNTSEHIVLEGALLVSMPDTPGQ
ncbi:Pectinesterase [Lasiodiplodia theobromae]|uniref:Pectinesterase n=1 Tax=Lasiodiplodia theobromae TaxID=45133 RepID=UPI0015C39A2D|nr:Pectinesterase [Lasiodiplodia theobromae]KAF4546472.1 Pectinesterase [Lasiodiplodia theobromae]